MGHLVQPPCRSRVTYSRLHRTLSRQVLNISREGESTTSLGSLFQCSTTLRGKKFFLMFRRNCCTGKRGSKKQSLPTVTDSYPLPSKCWLTYSPRKEIKHYAGSTAERKVSSEQLMETKPIAKCFLHPRCTCTFSGKSLLSPQQVSWLSGNGALTMPPTPVRRTLTGLALTFSSSFSSKE